MRIGHALCNDIEDERKTNPATEPLSVSPIVAARDPATGGRCSGGQGFTGVDWLVGDETAGMCNLTSLL